ncbi:GPW/gp25 family protein [Chrysiogenes arsenatis]|uniref:GPW/gp25 family protein n=1 Tax=Chrysiogenes arsenatis TaxID=309797 RepID=UPI000401503D|nr:GPW/gp25 family protein [Chrysiogenes arsenatis]
MKGMSAGDGSLLSGREHLYQSVRDILTTPLGSRVMRREYGSRLFELVDRPLSPALLVDMYTATAEALMHWESRLKVESVRAERVASGRVELMLTGRYRPTGEAVKLEGIVL